MLVDRRAHLALAAVVGTLVAALLAPPVAADPGSTVPNPGSRPIPVGPVALPGQGGTIPSGGQTTNLGFDSSTAVGPLAAQIMRDADELEAIGTQLTRAELAVTKATTALPRAEREWRQAEREFQDLKARAGTDASEAYKAATELGPFSDYADRVHQLSRLAPAVGSKPGGEALARDLIKAEAAAQKANQAYQDAAAALRDQTTTRDTLKTTYTTKSAALVALRTRNEDALRELERYEQSLGGGNLSEINIDGKLADPRALAAVIFALQQLGKPYLLGAEGPDSYDCSGLVQAAYAPYRTLPRIADDQYRGTRGIKASKKALGDLLIPGDLLFFNMKDGVVQHVGLYIGGGRMVHAPMPGDHVRIAPVWWSGFVSAARIFDAVDAPKPTSTPTKPGQPSATQTARPPRSQDPSPTKSPDPSPSPSPSESPKPPESPTPPQPPEDDHSSSSAPDTSVAASSH